MTKDYPFSSNAKLATTQCRMPRCKMFRGGSCADTRARMRMLPIGTRDLWMRVKHVTWIVCCRLYSWWAVFANQSSKCHQKTRLSIAYNAFFIIYKKVKTLWGPRSFCRRLAGRELKETFSRMLVNFGWCLRTVSRQRWKVRRSKASYQDFSRAK